MKRKNGRLVAGYWYWVAAALFAAAGCMHKSPQSGTADDIQKALLCPDPSGDLLLIMETIFQTISKSSSGGFTTISGYEDMRLSAYDLSRGTLVARQVLGRRDRSGANLLGRAGGLAWVYSIDPKLGLHGRDVRTLSVQIDENRILSKNPFLQGKLSRPEVYRIADFYAYDDILGRVVLTDSGGYRYALDPVSFAAQRLPSTFSMSDLQENAGYFSNYVSCAGLHLSLQGEMRQTVMIDNRPIDPGISFLEGKFICDLDHARILTLSGSLRQRLELEVQGTQPEQAAAGRERLQVKRKMLDEVTRLVESPENVRHLSPYEQLLQPDPETFFVAHRSSTDRDARLLIDCLRMKEGGGLQTLWSVRLNELFYDINSARETSAFKVVFSKGNPSFNFHFIDMKADKLVIIHMLHAVCIDIKNGNILWVFRF